MMKYLKLFAICFLVFAKPAHAANLAPTITPISPQTQLEGSTLNLTIQASDPEGSPVTLSPKNFKSWMSLAGTTFTAKPGLSDAGTYTVTITASDGARASSASFTLTVTNVNQAPSINPVSAKTMSEGGSLSFRVVTSDPDRDPVSVSATPLLSWMSFDGQTFTAKPGYSDSGNYSITFTANDGYASATTQTTITVNNINQAPVFSTSSNQKVSEGQTLILPIQATDPDGDTLTLTAGSLKSWMSFDGKNLSLSPGYSDAGTYAPTITASDGLKQTKLTLSIEVTNINRAPDLQPMGSWDMGDGKVMSLPVSASDPDGDAITLSASGLQSWMSFDGKVFRARPPLGTLGTYTVTLSASDASVSTSQNMTVSVISGGKGYPESWNQYMGSVGGKAAWATWVRHWLVASTGMNLVNDPSLVSSLYSSAAEDLATHDLMLPITAFVRDGASMSDFLNLIHDGGVNTWREAVRAEVETLAQLDPTGKRVVYHLGNEITENTISSNLRNWASTRGITIPGTATSFDPDMIHYYVEYFLAPTVDQVMTSSASYLGDERAATIALGSVGNAALSQARGWLDQILSYQVQGTYAPALAGKYVYELVDLITVHYVGPNDNLDEIWNKWKGQGRLRGLWTSEEIGSKAADAGQGAGRGLLTTAEQLEWVYRRGLSKEQTRVAYYDWNVDGTVAGASVNEAITTLKDFVGDAALEVFPDGVTLTGTTSELQSYRFNSLLDEAKRMVVVATNFSAATVNASVSKVQVNQEGWTGNISATVHHFSPAGHAILPASVVATASSYEVTLNNAVTFQGDGHALLILLQRL